MDFDERILSEPNPFGDRVVHSAWDSLAPLDDIEAIHRPVRVLLEQTIGDVRQSGASRGVLLAGEAGAGKTHLLCWLRQRLGREAFFCYVKPFLDPRRVFRHIARAVISDLARPQRKGGRPQLARLLDPVIREVHASVGGGGDLRAFREGLDRDPVQARAACRRGAAILASREPGLDRRWLRVLLQVGFPETRHAALEWLRGEPLEASDLAALEVSGPLVPVGASLEETEGRFRELLEQLGHLMAGVRPLVLSFDQNESLADAPGLKGSDALTRAICLLHMAPGYVLLTSVEVNHWKQHVERGMLASHRDRVAERSCLLRGVRRREAERLVAARMARLRTSEAKPPSPTYPFGEGFFRAFDEGPVEVRSLLGACGREIARMKAAGAVEVVGGLGERPAAAAPTEGEREESLGELVDAFFHGALVSAEQDETELEDAALREVLREVLCVAARAARPLAGVVVEGVRPAEEEGVDLKIVLGGSSRSLVGLSVLHQPASPLTLAAAFRAQLRTLEHGTIPRILTLRRGGLRPGWKKALALHKELRRTGSGLVSLDRRSEALLAATWALLGGARRGDLTVGGRRVEPTEALRVAVGLGRLDGLGVLEVLRPGGRLRAEAPREAAAPVGAARSLGSSTSTSPSAASACAASDEDAALGQRFLAIVETFELASCRVVEEGLREGSPGLTRQRIVAIGRRLSEERLVRVIGPDSLEPVYACAERAAG